MPKKEASLKVAANTPITASCNAVANLYKIDIVLNISSRKYHIFQCVGACARTCARARVCVCGGEGMFKYININLINYMKINLLFYMQHAC